MAGNQLDSILLCNARIVLAEKTIPTANLLINQDRIGPILDSSQPRPSASHTFDLAGMTLFPGFIDVHIHGAAGVDTMNASADDLHRVSVFLAQNGVTGWLPTLVPDSPDTYQRAINAIDSLMTHQRTELPGEARALGVHYEGPFVNDQQCGALHSEHFRSFRHRGDLDSLPRLNESDANHLMTLAPEIDGGIELIKELNRQGWIASIGHTRASLEVLSQALSAGARHMTHFMNAMTPLHHRDIGAVGWGLVNDAVTFDLIADGIHINPAILKLIVGSKGTGSISLISDAIAAAGCGDGEYEIWGETITANQGRTQNTQGNIAGSVITMLDAVRLMLSLGFTENQVAQMSSTNPARLLHKEDACGSIETGKRADLVALDDQGNVRLTIVGGQVAVQDLS